MMIRFKALALCTALWGTNVAAAVTDFDWATLEKSSSLNFTDCYSEFKCAMLDVPLDWLNPADQPRGVTLAVIALPAVVDESDHSFAGTIITNPGGPGSSGTEHLLEYGKSLQAVADSANKKYQILSFDPRGVGESLPSADCWQNEFARQQDDQVEVVIGSPANGGDRTLSRILAHAKGFGQVCESSSKGGEHDIRNFMSTTSVARDMVALVDKLAEMREMPSETGASKLLYWGFSYGTVLGAYFTAMFPDRVGRMILEAVVDVEDYYNVSWSHNLDDADLVVEHLWDTCFAGGKNCSLYKDGDKSPQDIRTRFEEWYEQLDQNPGLYVTDTSITTVTPYSLADSILPALYKPLLRFGPLATALSQAMAGDFRALQHQKAPSFNTTGKSKEYTWQDDAGAAVACGDGVSRTNLTLGDYKAQLDFLVTQSPMFGPSASLIRATCSGWNYRPKYAFAGPWSTVQSGEAQPPLLFISAKLDPVTPLANAYRMAEKFPGSGVLVQDGAGHGTLEVPGRCRDVWIRKYLESGEVPPMGTMCQADCQPFQDCPELVS